MEEQQNNSEHTKNKINRWSKVKIQAKDCEKWKAFMNISTPPGKK
jgi:5-bromo-4-chloroindolyl phosphate hydrolysis protein